MSIALKREMSSLTEIYLIYAILYELIQLRKIGFQEYYKDLWNIVDLSFILTLVVEASRETKSTFLTLLLLLISCLKLLFFLRIFLSIGFIVMMIANVLSSLTGFLTIFALLNTFFALSYFVAADLDSSTSEKYFVDAFKLSLGSTDYVHQNADINLFLIWILIIIFMYIVMLNFVIAMVSETFNQVIKVYYQCNYKYRA
jgi:hypothetical protein